MIKSVGIDFASAGEHKVRCLDNRAQLCDGFSFQNGSNPVIVFKLTGLAWLVVAVYLKAQHLDCRW